MSTIAARRADWCQSLASIQTSPLTFCPNFAEVAARWNRWWAFEAERPLLMAEAPKTPGKAWGKGLDLIERPEEWLRNRRGQLEDSHHVGESLPAIRVDIGPVSTAAYLGAPLKLANEESTSWQEPIIDSWDEASLALDPDNEWLRRVLVLMEMVAADAAGSYLLCTPDLTGAIDTLSNMRGPQRLCVDVYENRDRVKQAALEVVDAWEYVFCEMYDLALSRGTGIIQWVAAWSDIPVTVPTCDFNALIGPDSFVDMCLPSLEEQGRRAGRLVFHLDGPAAARHAIALAESPQITAIQYTPGAATPSALEKVDLLRSIQDRGAPVFVEAPADEVESLAAALDPRGLAIRAAGVARPEDADRLFASIERNYA